MCVHLLRRNPHADDLNSAYQVGEILGGFLILSFSSSPFAYFRPQSSTFAPLLTTASFFLVLSVFLLIVFVFPLPPCFPFFSFLFPPPLCRCIARHTPIPYVWLESFQSFSSLGDIPVASNSLLGHHRLFEVPLVSGRFTLRVPLCFPRGGFSVSAWIRFFVSLWRYAAPFDLELTVCIREEGSIRRDFAFAFADNFELFDQLLLRRTDKNDCLFGTFRSKVDSK